VLASRYADGFRDPEGIAGIHFGLAGLRPMKFFFSETQLAHSPKQFMRHGRIVDPFENPNRTTTLIASLERAGLQRTEPKDYGRAPILKVHVDHYVAFLEGAYARFMELPNHGPEVLPNVYPYRGASASFAGRGKPRVSGILGRAGWYMGDLGCAIMESTFPAAYASAQTAITGAEEILSGAPAAFALCRPPGHHAQKPRPNPSACPDDQPHRRGFVLGL